MSINKLESGFEDLPMQDHRGKILKLTIQKDNVQETQEQLINFLSKINTQQYSLQDRRIILNDMIGYQTDLLSIRNEDNSSQVDEITSILTSRIKEVKKRRDKGMQYERSSSDIKTRIRKPGEHFVNQGFSNAGAKGGLTEDRYNGIIDKFSSIQLDVLPVWERDIIQREIRRFFYETFGLVFNGKHQNISQKMRKAVQEHINTRYGKEKHQSSEDKELQQKFEYYLEDYWYRGSTILYQPAIIYTEMFAYRTDAFDELIDSLLTTFENINELPNTIIRP